MFSADAYEVASSDIPWNLLSGRRILVTGASGFLGGHLIRCLLSLHRLGKVSAPIHVVAMVREKIKARERLFDLVDDPNIEIMQWDLSKIMQIQF